MSFANITWLFKVRILCFFCSSSFPLFSFWVSCTKPFSVWKLNFMLSGLVDRYSMTQYLAPVLTVLTMVPGTSVNTQWMFIEIIRGEWLFPQSVEISKTAILYVSSVKKFFLTIWNCLYKMSPKGISTKIFSFFGFYFRLVLSDEKLNLGSEPGKMVHSLMYNDYTLNVRTVC